MGMTGCIGDNRLQIRAGVNLDLINHISQGGEQHIHPAQQFRGILGRGIKYFKFEFPFQAGQIFRLVLEHSVIEGDGFHELPHQ